MTRNEIPALAWRALALAEIYEQRSNEFLSAKHRKAGTPQKPSACAKPPALPTATNPCDTLTPNAQPDNRIALGTRKGVSQSPGHPPNAPHPIKRKASSSYTACACFRNPSIFTGDICSNT